MEYFFILGRNPILSKAEVFSYLESRDLKYKELSFCGNNLIIDLEEEHKFNIQAFGGVLRSGEALFTGNRKELIEFINKDDLTIKEKFSYCLFKNPFAEDQDFESVFSEKFKSEKRKAFLKHSRRTLSRDTSRRSGKGRSKPGARVGKNKQESFTLSNAEVQFFISQDDEKASSKIYFGIANQDYSYTDVKKRDMQKPVRRQSLAISPRLSKIMINLSQVRQGELLLDPFCGVGCILQEALVKNINVVGIDKDQKAVANVKKNLKWLEKEYSVQATYTLLHDNALNTPKKSYSAIVTEPALGELVRKKLNEKDAKDYTRSFERKISPILRKLKDVKKPGARIVITLPRFEKSRVNTERICKETGLRVLDIADISFPVKESKPREFISRDVCVFV